MNRFEDGSEIVFDADGDWRKIDCCRTAVPEALIPADLLGKVKSSFPGACIVDIEKDGHGYDVELNNGLDINFDRKGRTRVDD